MTQYVRAINIANNSIKSFVFDTNTANTLNNAAVAEAVAISANVSAQAVNTFVTLQVQQVANTPPSINVISITDSSYNVLDDTAANTTGAFLRITGSNFQSGAIVMVGSTNTAISTTFVDSSTLRAQIPAIAAGTYPVYVVNTNGGTAIRINGLTTSPFPAWSTGTTLTSQTSGAAFGLSISATSDSNVTYSNTSALPAGTTLLANGWFYGANSVTANTTYSFTVKATDAENQDTDRTFSVTVISPPRLWTWGKDDLGELGLNTSGYLGRKSSPSQVSGTNWSLVSAGTDHTIATKTDGTLWAWGRNSEGQLGLNDGINRSSPVQIGTATNWNLVSAGYYVTVVTKTDGTLWSWGYNYYGQLGLTNILNRSSPTQVGSATTWSRVSTCVNSTVVTKTDGTLWTWGSNFRGQLGTNNTFYRSSPTQIGAGTTWNQVGSGRESLMATKTDGTLWTWGRNSEGTLGLNNTANRSSPTQVGTGTNWSRIDIGFNSTIATKTDGTLWSWGSNTYGELGLGDFVNRSSPTQVGSATNWNLVSAGTEFSIATKTDGTLWTWGYNFQGTLGIGNVGNKSNPTQVGTNTNWNQVSAGVDHVSATTNS